MGQDLIIPIPLQSEVVVENKSHKRTKSVISHTRKTQFKNRPTLSPTATANQSIRFREKWRRHPVTATGKQANYRNTLQKATNAKLNMAECPKQVVIFGSDISRSSLLFETHHSLYREAQQEERESRREKVGCEGNALFFYQYNFFFC